jgi:hypothetical protein
LAVWGNPYPVSIVASTHAHPRSVPMGHGSLHVDLKVNMEACRSLRGQACCKQHASPTWLWDEAHPPWSHHSLPCHLTPHGTTQDATVHPVGTHPHKRYLTVHCTFVQKDVCMRSVPALSPLWGRVWHVLARTCLDHDGCFRVFWPETADPSRAAQTFPQPKRNPACRKCIFKQVPSGRLRAGVGPGALSSAAAS